MGAGGSLPQPPRTGRKNSTDLEALLPGARSEQRNAGKVWLPYLAGGMNQDTAVPGFSY
jgi:pilus assembly protein CpaC